jgi:hypothetical protein
MKNIILLALAISTAPLHAIGHFDENPSHPAGPDDPQPPDPAAIASARYKAETEVFEQIVAEMETNDFFAGRRIEMPFHGQIHVVDRTDEELWYRKTTKMPKAPNIATLSGLLGSASGRANMNLRITVTTRDVDPDGTTHEEVWQIDSGAFLEAQLSCDEAKSKNHK